MQTTKSGVWLAIITGPLGISLSTFAGENLPIASPWRAHQADICLTGVAE